MTAAAATASFSCFEWNSANLAALLPCRRLEAASLAWASDFALSFATAFPSPDTVSVPSAAFPSTAPSADVSGAFPSPDTVSVPSAPTTAFSSVALSACAFPSTAPSAAFSVSVSSVALTTSCAFPSPDSVSGSGSDESADVSGSDESTDPSDESTASSVFFFFCFFCFFFFCFFCFFFFCFFWEILSCPSIVEPESESAASSAIPVFDTDCTDN